MRRVKIGKEFDFTVEVEGEGPSPRKETNKSRSRHVIAGREFEATMTLTGDAADTTDAFTRSNVVKTVAGLSIAFLIGSALLGLSTGDFAHLQSVWSVVGPVYGAMATYFFSDRKKE